MKDFLIELAQEVSTRLKKFNSKGKLITMKVFKLDFNLKVKRKAENAPEPKKFLGHGIVDNFSKSFNLKHVTDSSDLIGATAFQLFKEISCPAEEARGLGIHVSKLSFQVHF